MVYHTGYYIGKGLHVAIILGTALVSPFYRGRAEEIKKYQQYQQLISK